MWSCISDAVADSLRTYVEQNPSTSRGFLGVSVEEERRFHYLFPEEGEVSASEDSGSLSDLPSHSFSEVPGFRSSCERGFSLGRRGCGGASEGAA